MLCIVCGIRKATHGSRCATDRIVRSRPHYKGGWEQLSRQMRAEHLATVGPWCSGWQREGHWVDPQDLTVDHVTPRDASELAVLCRSCNSSKGAADARSSATT